ncbi:hypothetical protein [uncultured Clostridium sp.]|uniref:hypothetical protein n=1 Tax=uncultured Clostridium sp. TaxID=59620 RepID=UPI0025E2575D|nr:hypothetical protein [uncultured Clostridium sp.]
MNIVKKYEDLTKKEAMNNPEKAYSLIKLGLRFEKEIVRFSEKDMPKAYKNLTL